MVKIRTLKEAEFRKPTKTLSGVTPIAVVIKPRKCDHGTCLYCPSLNVPQSYTPASPAIMRAASLKYSPYKQVKIRLRAFKIMKHPVDKIELIIMGGTFLSYPISYQEEFVKNCYDALNYKKSKSLEQAIKLNETSNHRCVALCIETRPDICGLKEIKLMRSYGCTRVELGVQILDDEIYKKNNRGHTVDDVITATKLLKDSGFKVYYHYMVGLPGSNIKKDIQMFKKLFFDERFRPDGIKIYPCQVIKGSELEGWYKNKKYTPYSDKILMELLIKLKSLIPRYVRVMRIMREIPPEYLIAGTTRIDLRKIVKEEMQKRNLKCNCIRCREVGYSKMKIEKKDVQLCRIDYDASKGKEIFLSFEDTKNNILISLLRLRIPHKPFRKEINSKTALMREIHTYGPEVEIGKRLEDNWQHRGYGKLLVKEAERIAKKEFKMKKMVIISAVGTREYFYKLGYFLDGDYVSKSLD